MTPAFFFPVLVQKMPKRATQRSKGANREGGRKEQAKAPPTSEQDHQAMTPPERLRTDHSASLEAFSTDQREDDPNTPWSRLRAAIDELSYFWGAIVEGLPFVCLYVRSVIISYRGMHLLAQLESIWLQAGRHAGVQV